MELEEGTIINGKYRITALIGQGGMGAVYAGENTAIARKVAIKVLHAAVASQHGVVERFEREAQAAGRIGNDHILEVLDLGTLADGSRFMVMEFLDGENLEQRVERRGTLTPADVYPLVRQILVGLNAAHAAGIIHRDLKPENIFILKEKLGQKDFVKIIDFGISKFTSGTTDMRMTATGAVMGTPYYMAPEQARGSRESDHRSDIYAVGVILYKVLTGAVPFEGATFNELLFNIVLSNAPRPAELVPGLDPSFESIVRKAMAKDPTDRFQHCNDFIQALDGWATSGASVAVPTPSTPQSAAQLAMSGVNAAAGAALPPTTPAAGSSAQGSTPDAMGTNFNDSESTWDASAAHGTDASWTNSGISFTKKNNSGLWIGLALVAGIALVIVSTLMASDDETVATEDANTAQAPTLAAAPPATASNEPLEDESIQPTKTDTPAAASEVASAEAAPTSAATTQAASDKEVVAAKQPEPAAPQPIVKKPKKSYYRPKKPKPKTATPAPGPIETPRPIKKKKKKKPKPTNAEPDFGY